MKTSCYLGRGSLLVSPYEDGIEFLELSGESEISFKLQESVVTHQDGRNGVMEVVDTIVSTLSATLTAESGRVNSDTLQYLIKSYETSLDQGFPVNGSGIVKTLPGPIGRVNYLGAQNITAISVVGANAVVVGSGSYTLDAEYGFLTVNSLGGATFPLTVTISFDGGLTQGFYQPRDLKLRCLVKAVNGTTGKKVLGTFYKATLTLSNQFDLVSKEFKRFGINLTLSSDFDAQNVAVFGNYGNVVYINGE